MLDFLLNYTNSSIIAAIIACAISLSNLVYYVFTMFRGRTKPHLYTWLIWGVITWVIAVIQTIEGETVGAWLTYTVAAACTVRALLAISYGEKDITKSDRISLLSCLIAIIAWIVFKQPLLSVLLLTFIDLVGYYPTFRKSWHKPQEEAVISHLVFGIGYMFGVIALSEYNFVTATYPVAVMLSSYIFVIYVLIRRYVTTRN